MKKKTALVLIAVLLVLALSACTLLLNYKSIEIVGNIQTVFEKDEQLDLSKITLRATDKNGKVTDIPGTHSALKVTGFDTATPGQKTMRFSIGGAYIDIPYTVYTDLTKVDSAAKLKEALDNGYQNIKLTGNISDVNIVLQRDVTIVGGGAKLYGAIIDAVNYKLTLADINLVNGFTVKGKEATLENCTISLEGANTNIVGINYSTKKLVINYCSFKTAPENCFNYVIKTGSRDSEAVIKNTSVRCNFWYGLNVPKTFTIDSCEINSTLTTESPFKDSYGASFVNPNKNPVGIHFDANGGDTTIGINASVTNTKISNVQNVIRVYGLDLYNGKAGLWNFKWDNNDVSVNCNNIVNFSTKSYGSLDALKEAMGSDIKSRMVAAKNTEIKAANGKTITLKKLDGNTVLYNNALYVEKDGSTPYEFLGWDKDSKMVLRKDGRYYQLAVAYSADGLDTRTITPYTGDTSIFA